MPKGMWLSCSPAAKNLGDGRIDMCRFKTNRSSGAVYAMRKVKAQISLGFLDITGPEKGDRLLLHKVACPLFQP